MPPADVWEDEWYSSSDRIASGTRLVHPRVRDDDFERRRVDFLVPETRTYSGLHRTRSQGHSPAPNVTIVNTTRLDNESNPKIRSEQKSPHVEARGRSRKMPGEWGLEDEIAELRLEVARQGRSRSRSDHHHHHHRDDSPSHEFDRIQLLQANQRLKEAEEKLEMERREELLKRKMELKYMKNIHEREEEEARIKLDEERMKREWEYKHEREERKRLEREEEAKSREERLRQDWELKHEREERKRFERDEEVKLREERLRQDWELKHEREERKRSAREEEAKARENLMKKEWELKQEREERKRIEREEKEEEERKRLIAENIAKMKKKAEDEEAERQRIIADNVARMERRAREQEEERKRIVAENQIKMEKAARDAQEARQRAVDEFNKEKAEKEARAKAEQDRVVAEYEAKKVADAAKAKKQREELIMQLKIEEEQRKQKEKEEWERFLMKQKKKEEEEKERKEKQEKELEEEMRKRLSKFGFQDNQIHAMIKAEDAPKLQEGLSPANPLRLAHQPTYVKVHKEHLAVDTLMYYDIPYEVDRADPNYLIILREMEPRETEILFEHTRRLRTRSGTRLLIEERRDHGRPEYAWVRRRQPSRSPSRRRSSPRRVGGLREMFL